MNKKTEDLKVAIAKLYYDGIMIDDAFMEDIKSLADEFENEREDLINNFRLYEDNNLSILHNTLADLFCIDKNDVKTIFNKSQIRIKGLRFLTDDLHIHKVHNIFDDSNLIGRITEYVDMVNDFVKVNDSKGKMYYFHQPLYNINCIERDYADLKDKNSNNVYSHHAVDKESNVLVNDKILRDNLIILFKYLAYRKSI